MTETKHSIWTRLYRGETSFDFVGKRRRWFLISGTIIVLGLVSILFQGLKFSIDFKGGVEWEVRSNDSVAHVRDVVSAISPNMRQATVVVLTDRQTGARTIEVSAQASATGDSSEVTTVSNALAKMAGVSVNDVTINDVGPTWGHDITNKAGRALVIFLVAVVLYITFRFEGKMAIAALVALLHDILITAGVYSLSRFQVSPATVIAFLTILGYSLYDTIVVFDKVEENTKGLAASGRITYTETVNLSMNQVLMRSINTSIVAIIPVLSILLIGSYFLGATALQDFGLALFIGLLTGAYSSIFIAAPLLAVMKEREPRYSQIRQRVGNRASMTGLLTPAAAASGELLGTATAGTRGGGGGGRNKSGGSAASGAVAGKASGSGGGRRSAAETSATGTGYEGPLRPKASRPVVEPEGVDEVEVVTVGDGVDTAETAVPTGAPTRPKPAAAGKATSAPASNGASGGGSTNGGSGAAGAARPAPKPRPGAANRPGGSGGGGANRPGPRPRKKGRKR